jgi:hypothetical protein
MCRRVLLWLAAALSAAALFAATPAKAQLAPAPPTPLPEGITYPEFQGLGCLIGGTIVAISAATYAEVVTVGAATPLVIPVMAAGFVAGCGVGAIMSPGLWWIYRQL